NAGPAVFQLYWGSEGYTPIAYLPQIAAALGARLAYLDFVGTLLSMRFAGLLAMTALTAYAIAFAQRLSWSIVAHAILPAARYGRSGVSEEADALAYGMVAPARCLRAATDGARRP